MDEDILLKRNVVWCRMKTSSSTIVADARARQMSHFVGIEGWSDS